MTVDKNELKHESTKPKLIHNRTQLFESIIEQRLDTELHHKMYFTINCIVTVVVRPKCQIIF